MKAILYSLTVFVLAIGLLACSKKNENSDTASNPPGNSGGKNGPNQPGDSTLDAKSAALSSEQLLPESGAAFGKFYGKYKIQSCADKSKNSREFKFCDYDEVYVYADKPQQPDTTIVSFRKAAKDGGIQFITVSYTRPKNVNTVGSNNPGGEIEINYAETDQSATLVDNYQSAIVGGSKITHASEDSMSKTSDTDFKLSLKNMVEEIGFPNAHNYDYEFEILLRRQ